jgi:hypothetical protein
MKCFQFDGVLHIKVLFATIHAVLLTSVYIWLWVAASIYRKPWRKLKLLEMLIALWRLS